MVYVDDLSDCAEFDPPACFHGKSCHMWADTVEELMEMARRIRLDPGWIDNGRRGDFPHFDLTRRRRRAAILAGAKKRSLREYLRTVKGEQDMDFDDPDDIQTDRDSQQVVTASQLFARPPQDMVESLADAISGVQDVYRLQVALRYCVHVVSLYDYNTVKRMLDLPESCEETVPFNTEEDKRIAGGGA